jgi:hypothetical protein
MATPLRAFIQRYLGGTRGFDELAIYRLLTTMSACRIR